jgi:hypothetical protein
MAEWGSDHVKLGPISRTTLSWRFRVLLGLEPLWSWLGLGNHLTSPTSSWRSYRLWHRGAV